VTHDILEMLLAVGSIIGAAAAVTYWGGRISRSVETIAEQITALRSDIVAHSGRLERHAQKLEDHGQRLAVVETRQGG
jgi:hypothetical protein